MQMAWTSDSLRPYGTRAGRASHNAPRTAGPLMVALHAVGARSERTSIPMDAQIATDAAMAAAMLACTVVTKDGLATMAPCNPHTAVARLGRPCDAECCWNGLHQELLLHESANSAMPASAILVVATLGPRVAPCLPAASGSMVYEVASTA